MTEQALLEYQKRAEDFLSGGYRNENNCQVGNHAYQKADVIPTTLALILLDVLAALRFHQSIPKEKPS